MSRKYPPEFKRDVVAVARRGELTQDEIAADFGISAESVRRWVRQAGIDEGITDGVTTVEQNELVQLRREKRRVEMENEILRRGVLRQGHLPKMMFPLVRELAAEGIPVRLTCGVLGLSSQAFDKWRARPVCDRDWDDGHLLNAIVDVHTDDPEFGYRFITDELERAGHTVSEGRVHRLCRQNRIWSTTTRKARKGTGKRPGPAVHDDLVQRQFRADRPDTVWLTGITEHPTAEGKLYVCAINDVLSNRIVGYSIDERMRARLATSALRAPPSHAASRPAR